jgi:3-methyladenine DNA glycosylase AlkD
MNQIIQQIQQELRANADPQTKKTFQRFFKEQITYYGVKTATVKKIAKKYLKDIKPLKKQEIMSTCEQLLSSDYTEEAFVVSFWLPNLLEKFEAIDLSTFKWWIEKYINNWAKCDSFCNHTIGGLIEKDPTLINELKNWAKSKNRWLKRAAAVSLIVPAKEGKYLNSVFEISDILLCDNDDLVQKGYGWLLKEESRKHQQKVFDYVEKNKEKMPRTALRYAIELMPKELKIKAMKIS